MRSRTCIRRPFAYPSFRHPERSAERGVEGSLAMTRKVKDPSTPLRFAQDDGAGTRASLTMRRRHPERSEGSLTHASTLRAKPSPPALRNESAHFACTRSAAQVQTGQIGMVLRTTGQIWSCMGLIWPHFASRSPDLPSLRKSRPDLPSLSPTQHRQQAAGHQIPASYPQSDARFHRAQRRFCVMHIVFDRRSSPPPHHGPTSHSQTIRTK